MFVFFVTISLLVNFSSMWYLSSVGNGVMPGASSDHANLPEYYK